LPPLTGCAEHDTARLCWSQGLRRFEGHASAAAFAGAIRLSGIHRRPVVSWPEWLHKYIPNYGWAIVVLTLVINMVLFRCGFPAINHAENAARGAGDQQIQERYKKYKMNDPRKAEMNKEVMAIYSREGINRSAAAFKCSCRCLSGLG